MKKKIKSLLVLLFRVSVTVLLLVLLFHIKKIDVRELLADIKGADKLLLSLSFLLFLGIYILGYLRWQMLLRAAGVHLPVKRTVISYAGGVFFSLFLPSSIGGDLARSIDLSKHTQKPKEVIATVLLDRISGYVGMVIVILAALALGWQLVGGDATVLFSVAVIVAILVAGLLVLFNRFFHDQINRLLAAGPGLGRFRDALRNLLHEIHYFRNHKKIIFYNLIISIIVQAAGPVTFYVTALALGITGVNIIYFFIFIPIIGAVTLLPVSVGGFGVRESTSVILFAKAGLAQNPAAAIGFLNSFFIFICGAIGGLIYVLTVHHRRLQRNKPSALHPQ